jgi:hypothetical protein
VKKLFFGYRQAMKDLRKETKKEEKKAKRRARKANRMPGAAPNVPLEDFEDILSEDELVDERADDLVDELVGETTSTTRTKKKKPQAQYEKSKFYQRFLKIFNEVLLECEINDENSPDNPYYSPKLATIFLKNHLAILPLFMRSFSAVDHFDDSTVKRPNNGHVERKNRDVKERVNKDGSRGKMDIRKYIVKMEELLFEEDFKEILLEVPVMQAPRLARKRAKEGSQNVDAMAQWRGKELTGLFFNLPYLNFSIGK